MKEGKSVGADVLGRPQSQFNATSLSDRLRGYPPRAKPELAKQGATRGARRSTPTTTIGGGDLRLWDDPRIVGEAAAGAIELYAHAVTGTRLEPKTGKRMFDVISHILAWCYVRAIEASVKKEIEEQKKESEVFDDPNM